MAAEIRLRTGQFAKFASLKGFKTEQAKADALKVDQSTLHRVLKGTHAPSPRFIAGVLLAFPELEFADLFEVAPDDESVPA